MARPTMKDVAALAGVDTSTVSRALNKHTQTMLSEETVARVAAAALELGYRPNALARGLRTQRSRTIGMLVPDLTNPFFPPIVRGLEDAFAEAEYTLIIANTDNDEAREHAALQSLVSRQIDGLVLATSHIDHETVDPLDLTRLPTVLVNRRSRSGSVPSVVPDDAAGVTAVIDHLTGLGHARIAHVAGPQDLSTGRDRKEAFLRACEAHGVTRPPIEVGASFTAEAGREACGALLARTSDVTAIFAANDLLAIGCLHALRDAGLTVPGDVSLVGYNDMPLVDLIDPPLTTVHVQQYEMGREAARLLRDRLAHDGGEADTVFLTPSLVVRRSTAPPTAP